MARQVLPWVGAVVGNFIAPGVGATWGFAIGSAVGNIVDPMVIKGPEIGEGQAQTSTEGVPYNRVYGTACVSGNVMATGPIRKWVKKTSQGKGGPVHEEERMSMTFAIGIACHEIGGILRIWEDDKLVFDARPEGAQVSARENMHYSGQFRLFKGTRGQEPSSDLEAIFGVGNTPSYANRAYIVFPDRDLTDRRGSIPNFRFEVTTSDVVYNPSLFIGSAGMQAFSGTPGDYALTENSALSGEGLYWPYRTESTADGKYVLYSYSTPSIRVNKKDEETGVFSLVYTLPWIYGSSISKIRFSKSEKYLLVWSVDTGNGANYTLRSFAFDKETGSIDPTPIQETLIDQNYTDAPSPLGGLHGSWVDCALSFSPDGSKFTIPFHWRSNFVSMLIMYFDDEDGSFGKLVSKAQDPCTKDFPAGYLNGGCMWITDRFIASIPSNTLGNFTVRIIDTVSHPASTCVPTPDDELLKVISSFDILVPVGNSRNTSTKDGGKMVIIPDPSTWNVDILFPFVNSHDENYDFPWVRVSTATGAIGNSGFKYIERNPAPGNESAGLYHAVARSGDSNFLAAVSGGNTIDRLPTDVVVSIYRMNWISLKYELIQQITSGDIASDGVFFSGISTNGWITFSGSSFFAKATGKYYLENIIKDVADYCQPGLDLHMDTQEISGKVVDGFVIGQQYNAKNVISTLQQTHFFDPSEYDGKIRFIVRGKAVQHVLTEQDLLDDDPYTQLRRSSIEYPKLLNFIYQNPVSGYDTAMAPTHRSSPSVYVSGEKTINVPEVMTGEKAARISDIQMKIAWAEAAGKFNFSLPATWHDDIVPSDIVALYLNDTPYRLRVDKIERVDGELRIEANFDRQSAYSSFVSGIPDRVPTPPPPSLAGRMIQQYLNIPALIDSNDVLGYYIATAGATQAYSGGVVERRVDGSGEDFATILQVGAGKTMANLVNGISAASEHYRDTTNELLVSVYGLDVEAFQSVTDTVFLRENNAIAVVDADGEVEIIQFRDAEYLGNGQYRLSHLLRGRLNTTPRQFASGSTVVVLDDVDLVVVDASNIGVTFEHRATAYSEQPQDSETTLDSFAQPLMQTEFPVDLLRYELDGDEVTVEWSPRERFGTDINPIRSINWEGYQITYTDGTMTETHTTEEPFHVKDLSSYTLPVTVAVSQLNRYTGAGPAQTIEIT